FFMVYVLCVVVLFFPTRRSSDLEIIDLRTLYPLDHDLIRQSVQKTGRAVIVHEAQATGGLGNDLVSLINDTRSFPSPPVACASRSEEHTSELQSRFDLVCRLLLE